MNKDAERAISDILRRGNNVEIKKKDRGYVIIEVEKTIRYRAPAQLGTGREDNRSQES